MNKADIVIAVEEFATKHNLVHEDLYIGYEAAAVLHGVAESCDNVYIDVSSDLFEYIWCLEDGDINPVNRTQLNGDCVRFDKLMVHNWVIAGCNPVIVDGLQVVSMERLEEQLMYWQTSRGIDPVVSNRCKEILKGMPRVHR